MSRQRRGASLGRSRRTPVKAKDVGGPNLPWTPIVVVLGLVAVVGLVGYLIWQISQPAGESGAVKAEANDDPTLPGEWVDLPSIYGGPYSATAPHVSREVDFSEQGLPPAGGPHWGGGNCSLDPDDAPPFCGPVLPGIYRTPWPAGSLIHTMEHSGIVVWYNTTDQAIIGELEDFAKDHDDKNLVLTPYLEMEEETVAITVWARRDKFPVSEYSRERLDNFVSKLKCRFKPEDPLNVC